jgi:hypothetical protein
VENVIDLHQGFSGHELDELQPSLGSVAMAELDAAAALIKGDVPRAVRTHVVATKLFYQVVWDELRALFSRDRVGA